MIHAIIEAYYSLLMHTAFASAISIAIANAYHAILKHITHHYTLSMHIAAAIAIAVAIAISIAHCALLMHNINCHALLRHIMHY